MNKNQRPSRSRKESLKLRRMRKKYEKRSQILLMPNNQERTAASLIIGIICRGLVAASLVFGLTLLFADAMVMVEEIVPFTAVLLPSLIFTAVITAMCVRKTALVAGIVLIPAGLFAWITLVLGQDPMTYIGLSARYFVNTVIDRIAFAGLAELKLYKLTADYLSYDSAELMTVALAIFTLAVSAIVTHAVIKKVKIFYLAAVGAIFVMPVTAYNIIRDNWGFSMFVIAYCAVTALWAYDRKYLNMTEDKTVCAEMSELSGLFAETDLMQAIPDDVPLRREKKKRARGKDKNVEEALRIETPRDRKQRIKSERRAVADAKRDERREKREAKYRRRKRLSKREAFEAAALGGPVGAAVLAVMLIVIVLPTAAVSSTATGLPYIDDLMGQARVYVTAFLSGSEVDLNEAGTVGALDTGLRDIELNYPEYQEIIIATVEAPYNTPVYLRAWIGRDYADNQWTAADVAEIMAYRERFGEEFTPEMITEHFYEAIYPDFNEFPLSSGYRNNLKYGFITERVNVTRMYGNGVLLYMPSFTLPSTGLMRYNELEPSYLPHDAYFDGIWTSKYFVEGTQYSTVSNVTSMKMPNLGDMFRNGREYYRFTMEKYVMRDADDAIEDGTAEALVAEYETELERLGIVYSGDSLLYKYCFTMTPEEREAMKRMYRIENEYNDYVDEVYTKTNLEDNAEIKSLTVGILQAAADEGAFDGKLPVEIWMDTKGGVSEDYYHEIVLTLVNFLSEHMEYCIDEPETPETEVPADTDTPETSVEEETNAEPESEKKSAILEFLTETQTGYCVQYASSLTMMLRSIGIPARYCEGFMVGEYTTDFHGNDDPLTRYKANVYDSNAHAWVEVYYGTMGWVQYEATEPFLEAMYGSSTPEVEDNGKIDISDDVPDVPEFNVPDDEKNNDPLVPEEDPREKLVRIAIIAGAAVLILLIAGIIAYVTVFIKRAKRAVEHRRALIMETSEGGAEYDETEMHARASELIKGIFDVYTALELLPQRGELTPEYTARLFESIGDASEITPEMLFEAITKEEFGYGMSRRELARTSAYYSDLVTSVYDGLGHRDRFRLRYVKRII